MDPKIKPEMKRKLFEIREFKAYEEGGKVIIQGYANTKNVPDRYGDIPTVFAALRNNVYDLTDFLKNPVMLIDHVNRIDHVAGSYVKVEEDEVGLFVKGVFSNSDFPMIKHARTVYLEGHAKAFSIGGYWYYEDKDNPAHLTLAEICDISVVGIGADANALGVTSYEKALTALEYAAALMPGLKPEEIGELNQKGLHFCTGKGKCHSETEVKSEEFRRSVKAAEDLMNQNIGVAKDILSKIPKV